MPSTMTTREDAMAPRTDVGDALPKPFRMCDTGDWIVDALERGRNCVAMTTTTMDYKSASASAVAAKTTTFVLVMIFMMADPSRML